MDRMADYPHIVYISKDDIRQVYSDLYGGVDEIIIRQESTISGGTKGKIGALLSSVSGQISSILTRDKIEKIYFDEILKAKRVSRQVYF